jgi:hypothetical protein
MPEEPKLKNTFSLSALPALSAIAAIGVATAIIVGITAQHESAQGQYESAQGQYENDENAHPVPDGGSTVALLSFSIVLLGLSQRKIARAE